MPGFRPAERSSGRAGAGHAAGTTPPPTAARAGGAAAHPARPAPAGREPGRELPPQNAAERRGDPVAPGLPLTSNGAVFSFADLAASLLDSVVYISTSQRVTMSGRTPTPDDADDRKMPRPHEGRRTDELIRRARLRAKIFSTTSTTTTRRARMIRDRAVARLGLRHRSFRADRHQQPRHRRCRRDHRQLRRRRKFEAKIVGIDDKTDLALLKVKRRRRCRRRISAAPTRCASATGCSRSATRSASAGR